MGELDLAGQRDHVALVIIIVMLIDCLMLIMMMLIIIVVLITDMLIIITMLTTIKLTTMMLTTMMLTMYLVQLCPFVQSFHLGRGERGVDRHNLSISSLSSSLSSNHCNYHKYQ